MNSPIAYVGGKSRLAALITSMIPAHETYCEVCTGAGWVFFRKEPSISKSEVLNDLDSDLVSFYRVTQNHPEEFLKQFKWLLCLKDIVFPFIQKGVEAVNPKTFNATDCSIVREVLPVDVKRYRISTPYIVTIPSFE